MLVATIAAAIISTGASAELGASPNDYSIVPNQRLRAVAQASADTAPPAPIGCFGERLSGTKNMCERAFYNFPKVGDVAACAKICVADEKCVMFAWSANQTIQCRLSATCKQPTNTLPGFDGYFRTSSAGSCAPSPSGGSGVPGNWTRVFLHDAAAKGAVCIDGSPGAFYIRTSNADGTAPSDPTKWVVFMEGGGWASSLDESVSRIKTDLGSSKRYPAEPPHMEGVGMFGTFDSHTIVYNKYCDGGSWSGAVDNPPITYKNTTLYFRGRGLLNGIFDELLENRGMDKATEVLYAGCSAGGLTTYIHADWVTNTLKERAPSAKVVALADAMYSLNHVDFQQDTHWPHFMQWVYSTNDRTGASVNDACVTYMAEKFGVPKGNRSEGWRCMFGASVAPFVETPTFILNSKYDLWQSKQIIGAGDCGSNISSCPKPLLKFWTDYGNEMLSLLDSVPKRHGAYIHNCQQHCQTGSGPWDTDTVGGTSMHGAVTTWYAAAIKGTQESIPRSVDRCDVTPCSGDICDGKQY